MASTLTRWIHEQDDGGRLFAEERLIVATAESIWEEMERRSANKADIAAALGKSKAFVTQVLSGQRNMTLRTLADIAFALNAQVEVRLRPVMTSADWEFSELPRCSTRAESVVLDLTDNHSAANEWRVGSVAAPCAMTGVA